MRELSFHESNFVSGGSVVNPILLTEGGVQFVGSIGLLSGAYIGSFFHPIFGTITGAAIGAALPLILDVACDGLVHVYRQAGLISK